MSCPFDERTRRNKSALRSRRAAEEEASRALPCVHCKETTTTKCPCGQPICIICAEDVINSNEFITCGGVGCMLTDSQTVIAYARPFVHADDFDDVIKNTHKRWAQDKIEDGNAKYGFQICACCGDVVKTGKTRRVFPLTFTSCLQCGAHICDVCGQTQPDHPQSLADPSNPYSIDSTLKKRVRDFCLGVLDLKQRRADMLAQHQEEADLEAGIKASLKETGQDEEEPKPKRRREKSNQVKRELPEPVKMELDAEDEPPLLESLNNVVEPVAESAEVEPPLLESANAVEEAIEVYPPLLESAKAVELDPPLLETGAEAESPLLENAETVVEPTPLVETSGSDESDSEESSSDSESSGDSEDSEEAPDI